MRPHGQLSGRTFVTLVSILAFIAAGSGSAAASGGAEKIWIDAGRKMMSPDRRSISTELFEARARLRQQGAARAGSERRISVTASSGQTFTDPDDTSSLLDLKDLTHADDATTITYTALTYDSWLDSDLDFLEWDLDVNLDGSSFDFIVVAFWDPDSSSILAAVLDAGLNVATLAIVSRPASNAIQVSFPRWAIGNPGHYEYGVFSWFDTNGDMLIQDAETDFAPDLIYVHDLGGGGTVSFTDADDVSTLLDLKTISHTQGASNVTYTVETYEVWEPPDADLFLWALDTNRDGSVGDRFVFAGWNPSTSSLEAAVFNEFFQEVAPATVSRPGSNALQVSFEGSAIGNPSSYEYTVASWFDANLDGEIQNSEFDFTPSPYPHDVDATRTLYFAEGTVRPGFVEFLVFQNAGTINTTAQVTFQASNDAGAPVAVPQLNRVIPAQSRVTVNLNDYLTDNGVATPINISAKVTSAQPLVAERVLYFNTGLAGGVDGGTAAVGASVTSEVWYFAEGTVRPGFVEFLTLQNPGITDANAVLSYQARNDSGIGIVVPDDPRPVPAGSRVTINVNDYLVAKGVAAPINISVKVTSDQPIVAERPMYFKTGLAGGVDGGTDVIGATAPLADWYFAEGTVRDGFVEFMTLQNPGEFDAFVDLIFQARNDAGSPIIIPDLSRTVPAGSRETINLNDYLASIGAPKPVNLSVRVSSDEPIVAERPLYFNTGLAGGADGGTDVVGAMGPSDTYFFAEGTVRSGFVEFLTLQNPGDTNATAELAFQASNDAGATVLVPSADVDVPAASRVTININEYLAVYGVPTPINISVKVTSTDRIVAERPIYFRTGLAGGVDGGTVVVGYSP